MTWVLLDQSGNELDCKGCSGISYSGQGGKFEIAIKASSAYLGNESEFAVKIFYAKTSPASPTPISHQFLRDDQSNRCDPVHGNLIYLRHLEFSEDLHIFDDTSIPFSGKVTVADTNGCILNGVRVCANHNGTLGVTEEIVCVESDSSGLYSLPIVAVARVDFLEFHYHDHEFVSSNPEKDFTGGILVIAENVPFI